MTYIVGSAHYEYDGDHDGANSVKPKYNLPTSEKYIGFFEDEWFISTVNPTSDAEKPGENDEIIAQIVPNSADSNSTEEVEDQHCPPIGLWSVRMSSLLHLNW